LWDCEFVGWSDPKITPNMPKPTSLMPTLTETQMSKNNLCPHVYA